MDNKDLENFLKETPTFDVKLLDVEVGSSYPIYGMVTKLISEDMNNIIVEVNHNIHIQLTIQSKSNLELLKSRFFEPGIFVTTIETIEGGITGHCSTIIFGKKEKYTYQ